MQFLGLTATMPNTLNGIRFRCKNYTEKRRNQIQNRYFFFGEFATVPQTHKLDKALPNYFA